MEESSFMTLPQPQDILKVCPQILSLWDLQFPRRLWEPFRSLQWVLKMRALWDFFWKYKVICKFKTSFKINIVTFFCQVSKHFPRALVSKETKFFQSDIHKYALWSLRKRILSADREAVTAHTIHPLILMLQLPLHRCPVAMHRFAFIDTKTWNIPLEKKTFQEQ